ncbi:MAG: hypothetical protein HY820_30595 [Acidobacteria bacterium]|nr:hypothetical protein [Acidobacteriota bacterium]
MGRYIVRESAILKPERKLLAVFLGVALAPASLAVWLALRLFQQDVAMETERLRELRDRYADQAVQSLARKLAEWEDSVRKLPPGSVHAAGATLAASFCRESTIFSRTDHLLTCVARLLSLITRDFIPGRDGDGAVGGEKRPVLRQKLAALSPMGVRWRPAFSDALAAAIRPH